LFLLDTNVVSELRKASRCDPRVAAWQASQSAAACFLSAVTVMEIRLGIELARRNDARKALVLEEWLEQRVKKVFDGRILPVDTAIAEKCALLRAERPRAFRDGLILATAVAHGLTVVTRNTKDFAGAAVPVVDPWR
jgi:predicted nucleic acid-binding protein